MSGGPDECGRGRRRRALKGLGSWQDLGGRGCQRGSAVGFYAGVGKRRAGVLAATVIVGRQRGRRKASVAELSRGAGTSLACCGEWNGGEAERRKRDSGMEADGG